MKRMSVHPKERNYRDQALSRKLTLMRGSDHVRNDEVRL